MANLKEIRKRIGSVKSTQKITRAMKMVAGARLSRAQQRITAMRPYAVRTGHVLREVVAAAGAAGLDHPLLSKREEKSVLFLVVTSDRGLCGSFNSSLNKYAEREIARREAAGQRVQIATIGRKGRDYFRRRKATMFHVFEGVWEDLKLETAQQVAHRLLKPYLAGEFDAIYIVYNEFKSAMTQIVKAELLFPLGIDSVKQELEAEDAEEIEFIFEPDKAALMERLVPMYIEISILRALYESMASELGARMTAMDSATKNASDMIGSLTLKYNRARQAAITTELMEIIGGAEALNG